MPDIAPLPDRLARYERMKAMQDAGKTYEEIGAIFKITRERVRQVFDKPPRKPGPPFSAGKVQELRDKLAFWEARRAARIEKGKNTAQADERIAAITAQINEVRSFENP